MSRDPLPAYSLFISPTPAQWNTEAASSKSILLQHLASTSTYKMTTIRPIFIDDTDSRIQYTGHWFQHGGSQDPSQNYTPMYMHTMHGTKTNSSFSFSFYGTSVKIIGATYSTEIDDSSNLSWDCYVDNLKIDSSKLAMDSQDNLLCQSDSLSNSEHSITVYITTHNQTFWLDSIQFVPGDGDTGLYDNAITCIDNTDQALEWSTGWTAMQGNTTTKSTQVSDSSVRLNFIGTSVAWISRLSTELPRPASTASYSVDGGDQIPFTVPCPPQDDTDDLFNQPCFTTSQLGLGPHTLLVNYHGDNTSTPLNLDYLLVTNGTSSTSSSASAASQPPQPTPSPPNKKQGIISSIAVGVMGLIAVLSLIIASIYFRRKRRRKKLLIPLKMMKRMSLLSGTRSPTNEHPTTIPAIYHHPDSIPSPAPSALTFGSAHNLLAPPEEAHRRSPSPSSDTGSWYRGPYQDGAISPSSERVTGRLYVTNPSQLSISTCSVQAEVASTHSEEDEGKK